MLSPIGFGESLSVGVVSAIWWGRIDHMSTNGCMLLASASKLG